MSDKLHIRIAPDGSIEVTTEDIEPADVAALIPVLEAMLGAKATSARTAPVAAKPGAKARRTVAIGRRGHETKGGRRK